MSDLKHTPNIRRPAVSSAHRVPPVTQPTVHECDIVQTLDLDDGSSSTTELETQSLVQTPVLPVEPEPRINCLFHMPKRLDVSVRTITTPSGEIVVGGTQREVSLTVCGPTKITVVGTGPGHNDVELHTQTYTPDDIDADGLYRITRFK